MAALVLASLLPSQGDIGVVQRPSAYIIGGRAAEQALNGEDPEVGNLFESMGEADLGQVGLPSSFAVRYFDPSALGVEESRYREGAVGFACACSSETALSVCRRGLEANGWNVVASSASEDAAVWTAWRDGTQEEWAYFLVQSASEGCTVVVVAKGLE